MKRFPAWLLLLLSTFAWADELDDVKAYLDKTYSADRPGASVVIAEGNDIVLQEGYGLANVELGVPITPDTIFRVGSVTKQFTGAAIMLLEQRGELSVDDPISRYLPETDELLAQVRAAGFADVRRWPVFLGTAQLVTAVRAPGGRPSAPGAGR